MKTKPSFSRLTTCFSIVMLFSFMLLSAQKGDPGEFENSVLRSHKDPGLQWGPCPPFMPEGCNIAVLHGDPSQANADVLFRVQGNSFIPNHWHNSAERMVLLSGEMEVTYKGESTGTMKLGNYAYGPAKKPHTAKCVSKEPCVLFIGFVEPVDAFAIEE